MKTNRMQLMSEGDVSKSLFKLGIPMVVSMLVTALYNVVDTYFVSGLGTQQVAAVSVAFPISFIFSGIGLTFGVGAGSYISRLLGKQDMEKAHQVASTAMFSSVLTSIIAAGIIYAMLTPVLTFMGATETIMPFAKKYAVYFYHQHRVQRGQCNFRQFGRLSGSFQHFSHCHVDRSNFKYGS